MKASLTTPTFVVEAAEGIIQPVADDVKEMRDEKAALKCKVHRVAKEATQVRDAVSASDLRRDALASALSNFSTHSAPPRAAGSTDTPPQSGRAMPLSSEPEEAWTHLVQCALGAHKGFPGRAGRACRGSVRLAGRVCDRCAGVALRSSEQRTFRRSPLLRVTPTLLDDGVALEGAPV